MLYDSTYIGDLKQANAQRQTAEQRLPGAKERGGWTVLFIGYSFCWR